MNVLKVLGKPFTALSGKVNSSVEQKILIAVARHAATAIGAALVGHGVVAASSLGTVEDAIGTLLVAIATSSSISQKVDENKL